MAGEPEGRARRQAARCGSSAAVGRRPTRSRRLRPLRQPADRRPEHGALPPAGVRRALRASCRLLPDGPERIAVFREARAARARLHAVQVHPEPRSRSTWRSGASSAIAGRCSGRTGGSTSTSTTAAWRREARLESSRRSTRSSAGLTSWRFHVEPSSLAPPPARWRRISPGPPTTASARRAAEGAALRLRGRRDQPRSGQDQRPVLAHADAAHLRGPLRLRPPGPAGQDQAAHRRRHAADLRRLSRLDRHGSGPASTSPTIRRSRASGASSSPRTTSIR